MATLDAEVNFDDDEDPRPEDATSLRELLTTLPGSRRWDALLFTDGSGSTRARAGGYGGVILRKKGKPLAVAGSVTACTSQEAEVRALYETLLKLQLLRETRKSGGYHVYVITDSKYVADKLTAICKDPIEVYRAKAHHMLWLGIQHVTRHGIRITPVHIHRNENPLMVFADSVSKRARKSVEAIGIEPLLSNMLKYCEEHFSLEA